MEWEKIVFVDGQESFEENVRLDSRIESNTNAIIMMKNNFNLDLVNRTWTYHIVSV